MSWGWKGDPVLGFPLGLAQCPNGWSLHRWLLNGGFGSKKGGAGF